MQMLTAHIFQKDSIKQLFKSWKKLSGFILLVIDQNSLLQSIQ
jgi:hypothetical protein